MADALPQGTTATTFMVKVKQVANVHPGDRVFLEASGVLFGTIPASTLHALPAAAAQELLVPVYTVESGSRLTTPADKTMPKTKKRSNKRSTLWRSSVAVADDSGKAQFAEGLLYQTYITGAANRIEGEGRQPHAFGRRQAHLLALQAKVTEEELDQEGQVEGTRFHDRM